MLKNHGRAFLFVSQRPRYRLPTLTICFCLLASFYANGQNVSGSAKAPTVNKTCDGVQPAQVPAHQDESVTSVGTERWKLSTDGRRETPEPEGQYCRREKSEKSDASPSISSDRADPTPESDRPNIAPPIAQVTGGKLTIRANGQDFASVLESVRSVTGLTVEMPPSVNAEPVFLSVGPTSVTDALIALLHGTSYNYIIVGSERDPQVVQRLILTERTSAGSGTLISSKQPVEPQPALYGGVQPDTDAEVSEPPPPPPPAPIQPAAISSSIPTGINIQKMAAESGKTTGQILDELQKRQQQVLDDQAASQSQSAPQQ